MLVLLVLGITNSAVVVTGNTNHFKFLTRRFEFDYFSWSATALIDKFSAISMHITDQLHPEQRQAVVSEYLQVTQQIVENEMQITTALSDPENIVSENEMDRLFNQAQVTQNYLNEIQPIAELIFQNQISETVRKLGISHSSFSFPPILFKTTPLPKQMIISPRTQIRQDASFSLIPEIDIENITLIEIAIEEAFDVSALVVPLGGVGTYPSMVTQTSNIVYLLDTAAHEWAHHYLAFFPLGFHYTASPELRTINETVASIAGAEISDAVLQLFYPEKIDEETNDKNFAIAFGEKDATTEPFDFRKEMYETRKQVDSYLEEGLVELAEEYMENRRKIFWENGYQIRRLNQAYFAFHGAYSDQPFSAAGVDPVGAAVRALRAKSTTLAEFFQRIKWISDVQSLYDAAYSY